MAGQNFDRREILRILSLAATAAQFPGFERWAFACPQHPDEGLVRAPGQAFRPQFFTQPEYALVEILADLIIPSDGRPARKKRGQVNLSTSWCIAIPTCSRLSLWLGLAGWP